MSGTAPSLTVWGLCLGGVAVGGLLEWAGCREMAGFCWGAAVVGLLLSRAGDGALVPGPTPLADPPETPSPLWPKPVLVPLPQSVGASIPGVPVSRDRRPNSRSSSVRRAYHPVPPLTRPPSTRTLLKTPDIRLLVMDEDDISRQTICATLEAWGIESLGVTSPAEAAMQIRIGQQSKQQINALIILGSHSLDQATGMVDRVASDLGLPPIRIIRLSLMGSSGEGPSSRVQTLPLPLEETSFREALQQDLTGSVSRSAARAIPETALGSIPPLPLFQPSQKAPASESTDTVFDPRLLHELLDQLGSEGPQVIAGLISDFLAGIEDQLRRLDGAITAQNSTEVAAVSHRLRGQCLQLGLQRLVTQLQNLESAANKQDLSTARDTFHNIQRTWGPSKTALLNRS